jgi:hypothetical protein
MPDYCQTHKVKVQEPDLRELVLSAVGEEVLLQPPGLNGEEPGDGVRGD